MNQILSSEMPVVPHLPDGVERLASGLLAPHGFSELSNAGNSAKVLVPANVNDPRILLPKEADVLRFANPASSRSSRLTSTEVALAVTDFDLYFTQQLHKTFPEYGAMLTSPKEIDYRRTVYERGYYNKATDSREIIQVSGPGPVEQECVVALRIASEPQLMGTEAASKALKRVTTLIEAWQSDEGQRTPVPEMPDLIAEITTYLGRQHKQRHVRYKIYDMLETISIPKQSISPIGLRMEKAGDLKHPLAYKLFIESAPDSEWACSQRMRRENLLTLLGGSPQQMLDMYSDLQWLAQGLVCAMDVHEPPDGMIGVEFEFGLGDTASYPPPPRFRVYKDRDGNEEISRLKSHVGLNRQYLSDLVSLAEYLEHSSHVSSMHLHLDDSLHPRRPEIGDLLGNDNSTIILGRETPTWEVRGLLPPTNKRSIDPAGVVAAIQLYISAAEHEVVPYGALTVGEKSTSVEQIIFAHICRHNNDPLGRLAALKLLEHPLALKAVNPRSILANFDGRSHHQVYETLKEGLYGSFAQTEIRRIGFKRGYEKPAQYSLERLAIEDLQLQYTEQLDLLKEFGLVSHLESGKFGIVGVDGVSYPVPTLEDVAQEIEERIGELGPKMEQGFRKLLLVPFGLSLKELSDKYASELLDVDASEGLLATKKNPNDDDEVLELDRNQPVYVTARYGYPFNGGSRDYGGVAYFIDNSFRNTQTKEERLKATKNGWRVVLVEDLPILKKETHGDLVGGRLQLEHGTNYLSFTRSLLDEPGYEHESGMIPEDMLMYALSHLRKTGEVVDDVEGVGSLSHLPGAVLDGYIPRSCWIRSLRCYLLGNDSLLSSSLGPRTVVSIN